MKYNISHINVFHMLVLAPLLIYLGKKKDKANKKLYYLLGIIALSIPLSVHFPRSLNLSYWNMVKILHYAVFMPGLLYIAYKQKLTKNGYDGLFILGIIIFIYHGYKLSGRLNRLV